MNCLTAGQIRDDGGSCVAIESYLSTGSNAVYWISESNGNDGNPGTKSQPWKTIARANRTNQLKPGDAVIIRGGTYRETIRPVSEGRSGARLTFAAYPGENVVISGAEVTNSGWMLHSGKIYKHVYTDNLDASCPWQDCSDVAWRRELIAVNGQLLTQVASLTEMTAGTYYVNGNPPATAPTTMYVWFPNGNPPEAFNIEIGKLPVLFLPTKSPETCAGGDQGHYRLIGLTFRYAVNMVQRGAVCPGTQGSLIEEITVEKTSSYGMRAAGNNHVFRGNTIQDNGQAGIGGGCDNCLLEYNASLRNNWRHHFFGYEQGGGKFANANNTTLRYHLAKDNEGVGVWFDGDNLNNIVENSMFVNNLGAGIFLEMNSKYNIIRNSVFYGTRYHRWTGAGILSHATSYNIFQHNTIVANEGIGLWIRRDPGNRAPEGNNKIYNNLLVNNGTSTSTDPSVFKYEIFVCTNDNQMDGNQYLTHSDKRTFYYGPGRWAGDDITTWRTHTGADAKAGMLSTLLPIIESLTSFTGWRIVPLSQALQKGSRLPAGYEVPYDIDNTSRPAVAADVGADQFLGGTTPPPDDPVAIGEAGVITASQSSATQWQTVTLRQSYNNPVVVAGGLSFNGDQPTVVRIKNVTSNSFQFQLDEWDYLDGTHTAESVNYLVMESGIHTMTDGTVVQAGTVIGNSTQKVVPFHTSFADVPVVISQVVTANAGRAVITRQKNISKTGYTLFLQGQESNPSYSNETVAWIAMDKKTGVAGTQTFSVQPTQNVVTQNWYTINLNAGFTGAPVFVSGMQTTDGIDPAGVRYRNLTNSSVQVMVEEENSKDPEISHTSEIVGYFSFDAGPIVAQATQAVGKSNLNSPVAALDGAVALPKSFELMANYPNPFNPVTTLRYAIPEDAPVTLEIFDVAGRRIAILVDEYQSAAAYEVPFDAGNLPSGVYLYRLRAGPSIQTRKMILSK